MHKWIALSVALVALAGCATQDDATDSGSKAPLPGAPLLEDAYAAWNAGNLTANVRPVGHWQQSGGEEADGCGDWVAVDRGSQVHILGVVWADGNATFVELAVITDAPGPKDVKWSDDCDWLFVGNDDVASSPPLDAARVGGIYVYDVADKENPLQKSKLPIGPRRGPHMVFYHQTSAGDELVFGANGDVSISRFDRATGTLTELARYAPDYVQDVNREPDVIDAYYQTYAHDMFVMEDPATGQTLMYVANWDAGLRIVDVSVPDQPLEVGAWNDFPAGHSGNIHTVSTAWIGGRRITVASPEVGFEVVGGLPYVRNDERSPVYVLDTTRLSAPAHIGTWFNPDGEGPGRSGVAVAAVTQEEIRSPHNLQLEGGRVYLAHYGLGVFVLDISTAANQSAPVMVGYVSAPGDNVWDVIVHDGAMLASGALGLRADHFLGDLVGPFGTDSRA